MKNRINLFRQKPQLDIISVNAPKLKKIFTTVGIITFGLFLFLIVQTIQLDLKLRDLNKKKETYLKYLLDDKDTEANMRYFKSKQTQLNNFLKDDANFLPYYTILKQSLDQSGNTAILDTITIDKNRETRFVVKFTNYEDMIAFLKYIESDGFLKNFTSLSLDSFNLNQNISSIKNYQLELKGIFKELKETT